MATKSTGEKKQVKRTFVDAKTGKVIDESTITTTRPQDVATTVRVNRVTGSDGNPGNRRPIAIALWVVAIIFEALAFFSIKQDSPVYGLPPFANPLVWTIIFIVLDLICCVIAGQLWKQANHIDPPSEKNQVEFFLKSQLGAIMSVVAFLPLIILILVDNSADKRTKTIATIVAVVALAIGVGTGADFNPVSAESLEEMEANAIELGDGTVYWTPGGSVYHLNKDCYHILNSTDIVMGTAAEAMEAGKNRPCKYCAQKSGDETLQALSNSEDTTAANTTKRTQSLEEIQANADALGNGTIYWVESSPVYHLDKDCSILSDPEITEMYAGNAETAKKEGKDIPCELCAQDASSTSQTDVAD